MADKNIKSLFFRGLFVILKRSKGLQDKGKVFLVELQASALKITPLSFFIYSYTYGIKFSEASGHQVINGTPQCKWSETQGGKQPFAFKYFSFLGL